VLDHRRQRRGLGRLAEFTDVGAAAEVAACSDQQDGGHGRVVGGAVDGGQQPVPDLHAKGIDRWVIQGQH